MNKAVANAKQALCHVSKTARKLPGRVNQPGACRMNCPVGAIAVSSGAGCAAAILDSMRRGDPNGASCECS
jgi:hypothetical protein